MRPTKITGDLPRRVKAATILHNHPYVTNKYPNRLTDGFSQALLHLIVQQEITSFQARELPGDIIYSIRGQNKGRACGLFMDSLDFFI